MSDARSLIESFYAAGGPVADPATLSELFHPDYVSHTSPPGMAPGIGQAIGLREFLTSTFDDIHYELIRTAVDGDLVATHTRLSATHAGDGLGFPATGRSFTAEQMHFVRIADGRIVEHWAVRDDAAMMRQIGAIPAGAPA
jgi:predicted ester cyclase